MGAHAPLFSVRRCQQKTPKFFASIYVRQRSYNGIAMKGRKTNVFTAQAET